MLALLLACAGGADSIDSAGSAALPMVVVTWNTGTTEGLDHDALPDDGYGSEDALLSDTWYGDGLAWIPAVDAATDFLQELQPDVVVFQEIFWSDLCAVIPSDAWGNFICSRWQAGDPTVAQKILGDGWQVACHPGHPDKCAAVRDTIGRFEGCDEDFCLEGLVGSTIEGCGKGARVGRGVVIKDGASPFTLVNVHGSSGLTADDQACRAAQVDQVFLDLGDGAPAANGKINLIMGDFNTDPGRWADFDESAARWDQYVGGDSPFQWITQVGPDAPETYQGAANIDHVISDTFVGSCVHPGVSPDTAPVIDATYFDHVPAVCTIGP